MQVSVVLAYKMEQIEVEVILPSGGSVDAALHAAAKVHEAIAAAVNAGCDVGVWGKLAALGQELRDGDRLELYRPLRADPKETRRRRARKKSGRG